MPHGETEKHLRQLPLPQSGGEHGLAALRGQISELLEHRKFRVQRRQNLLVGGSGFGWEVKVLCLAQKLRPRLHVRCLPLLHPA